MARADLVRDPPAGFGFALTIHPPMPLVDTTGPFTVPPEALCEWVAEAEEGARCVYARVETMVRHPRLRDRAQLLAGQGVVTLNATRHAAGDGLFDYIAKRTFLRPPGAAPRIAAPVAAAESLESGLDAAAALIFDELQRAARRGVRCPSDLDLAREAKLATRHQAAWRVRKLAAEGKIAIETLTGPDRLPWRVVTIGKRSTARPPA